MGDTDDGNVDSDGCSTDDTDAFDVDNDADGTVVAVLVFAFVFAFAADKGDVDANGMLMDDDGREDLLSCRTTCCNGPETTGRPLEDFNMMGDR